MRLSLALSLCLAAACGGGSSSSPDAPVSGIDSAPAEVEVVACTGVTPAATVTVVNFQFSPSATTINVGDVVHLMPTASHPTASGSGGTPDGKFNVSSDACLKFTKAGTYPFYCIPHGFTGTITVQ